MTQARATSSSIIHEPQAANADGSRLSSPVSSSGAFAGVSLRIDALSYTFRDGSPDAVHALRGISLDLPATRRYALVGPSGSGKSTLLRIIAGVASPTAGTVCFSPPLRCGQCGTVSALFQGTSHLPWRTVAQNIGLRLEIQGEPREKRRSEAADLCKAVDLDPTIYMDRYLHDLAGGQKRRVELAMALAGSPAVLLLDEPTTALDFATRRHVQVVLERAILKPDQMTLLATHDIEEAVLLSDRVIALRDGVIVGEVSVPMPWPRTPQRSALRDLPELVEQVLQLVAPKPEEA